MIGLFQFNGMYFPYLDHPYNATRYNERAVEVPLAIDLLNKARGRVCLEVGAVLPHYIQPFYRRHVVVDKYETGAGITNGDVLTWDPGTQRYSCIVSISTLEHLSNVDAIREAVRRMRSWLWSQGTILITIPHGAHGKHPGVPEGIDELVLSGELGLHLYRMDKVDPDRNLWFQVPTASEPLAYGEQSRHANSLYILIGGA